MRCCIAGGGPAGMMLGYLLARAGVEVVVLEKHADFLRDFRGDTVHPSTLQVMAELGLLETFLARPHQQLEQIGGIVGDTQVTVADFRHLPTTCRFVVLVPQWDFLNFLSEQGRRYSTFRVAMETAATDLIVEDGTVVGVQATGPQGPFAIRADLVVGADGRHSTIRDRAALTGRDFGVPIDVLWMRLSKRPDDPTSTLGRFQPGRVLVTLDHGDYWQCAYVIPKGGFAALQARGLQALRDDIAAIAPFTRDRLGELRDWDDVKLLTVTVDRLERWYRPGLLCIGDAAHAMSPLGGVGINLAIQDAVATANLLAAPLRTGTLAVHDLRAVERRRMLAIKLTQGVQVFAQNRILSRLLSAQQRATPGPLPLPFRLLQRFPHLRRFPALAIGVGFRPEHVRTPEFRDAAADAAQPATAP